VSPVIVEFTVNGEQVSARVSHPGSLLDLLRDDLGLPGSKDACEQGECGSCSVILDGDLVCSCLVMAADVAGSSLTTVEGVGSGDALHPVQEAMQQAGAVQCGFCTPGIVVAAVDLFGRNPSPTPLDIREALAGNICRCTGYGAILRALERVASESGT
jgi:carbon-monoxide dehydrogenase small subunit